MKLYFLLILLTGITLACNKKKSSSGDGSRTDLLGKWKLSEYRMDIGNGDTTWKKAGEQSTVNFTADGKVTGSYFQGEYNRYITRGQYDLVIYRYGNTADSTQYRYFIRAGQLVISQYCIEACGSRFVPVE